MVTNWQKLNEEVVYKGWRNMLRRRFMLPGGEEMDFDIFNGGDFVTVAAITQSREFLLIRQFRPGPESIQISFPEGAIDNEESPLATARRELLEETGYAAGEIHFLREIAHSYSTGRQFLLLATDCCKVQEPQLDRTEFIETFTVPVPEFRLLLRNPADRQFHNIDAGYMALEFMGWL